MVRDEEIKGARGEALSTEGTEFQREVWSELSKIPHGETVTYGEIAARIGRPKASRAVGSAVGANPIVPLVPCHRVLPSTGKVGNYRLGSERKKELLAGEKQKTRAAKTITSSQAVELIKDGWTVVCSHAAAGPQVIMRELVAQKHRFSDLHIFHVLPVGYSDYLLPENTPHFRHLTTFVGVGSRAAMAQGLVDFIPSFFKDVPALLGSEIPVDVAVMNVSVPDADGYCSLGVSCDYGLAALAKARLVIAQINDKMPRVGSRTNAVHISRFDYIVPCSDPLPEVPPAQISSTEKEIARHCASLIEDGDTLQLGIGAIPDGVLGFLSNHKHLGLHSEMLSDGAVPLIRSGVIDGSRKTLHRGKIVTSFLVGSKTLWDFVANNPLIEMLPVDYVNDPRVIAQNDRMVSINSCLQVDLTGQVNAETLGGNQFSGTGGQVDFVRGALWSRGGRSIIAMPSTAQDGKVSRIVHSLGAGSAVTTSRCDVDYIVTEYGIAHLRGRTLKQRAEALRAIAHPDFRDKI